MSAYPGGVQSDAPSAEAPSEGVSGAPTGVGARLAKLERDMGVLCRFVHALAQGHEALAEAVRPVLADYAGYQRANAVPAAAGGGGAVH